MKQFYNSNFDIVGEGFNLSDCCHFRSFITFTLFSVLTPLCLPSCLSSLCYSKTTAHFLPFLSFALFPSCFTLALCFLFPSVQTDLRLSSFIYDILLCSLPPSSYLLSLLPHLTPLLPTIFPLGSFCPFSSLTLSLVTRCCPFSSPVCATHVFPLFLLPSLLYLPHCLFPLSSLLLFSCRPPLSMFSPLPLLSFLSFIT